MLLPGAVFGQAVQRSDSSVFEAGRTDPGNMKVKQKVEVVQTTPSDLEPEGSPCGWTADTVSPIPILDQGTVTVGSNLYTFAGVSTSIIATANKFNGTTWSSVASVPTALEYPTVVSDGTSAYIINGVTGTGDSTNTLYRYNPATNDYTTLATSNSSTSSWNAAGAYLNGKIYKIGGYHSAAGASSSLATVEIYDIASNTWSTGASYPLSQGWESAFVSGNFIYVAGGLAAEAGSLPSTKTYRYDPSTNTWDDASIADLPLSRWGAASSQTAYNGGWVLAGGYVNGTDASNLSNTAVEWNPVTNTWSSLPSMGQARSRMTGAVLNGAFYVIGGRSTAGGFAGTNDNQKLFCIPSDQPFIQGGVTYVSDNGTPANNVPDPGETVTVSLDLHNGGGASTGSNVTATLANTGGITNPSGPQNYGTIASGATVSRNFTFQVPANAPCGGQITLTFDVADGSTHYTVTKTYDLGVLQVTLSQNFDGVTPPALPAGWVQDQTVGTGITWVTTTTSPSSSPNAAFGNDVGSVNATALESPAFNVTSASARVSFKNSYNTESTFDGMVLEIKIGAGNWTDIVTAGGTFVSGDYNATISSSFQSPIAGRRAWSGNSNGYVNTVATLPASANGQSVQLRWLMASDESVSATGAWVDDVVISGGYLCSTVGGETVRSRADFDGDGKTDLSVFRPSQGVWYLLQTTAGFGGVNWGISTDVVTPGDFNGDGRTDLAIFRANNDSTQPDFYILLAGSTTFTGVSWGVPGDIPLIADYDGDGKADIAVYRPSEQTFYILKSGGGIVVQQYGQAGDIPVAGNFIGDSKADITVFRPSTNQWVIFNGTGDTVVNFGATGDLLVPADYDGDNTDDIAVFRPSTGEFIYQPSSGGSPVFVRWGTAGDIPVPGDYDGDGKDDPAIYRNGTWWINASTAGISVANFGVASDTPIPRAYLP
jgi:N-acetylneuraminic acid mutarotase